MDHTNMLTEVLKLNFGWHLARVKCLSCLIMALFKVKTVNFQELATAFRARRKWTLTTGGFNDFSKKSRFNPI